MYIKSLLFFIVMLISFNSAFAQEHQHNDHLDNLLEHYMDTKDALTEDDFETARSHISELKEDVLENEEMNNHEEHPEMHAKHHGSMIEAVNKADQAGSISELRSAFKDITENLAKALENQGYDQDTLYLQYCPMAVNNEGAHWISNREDIINPYMGEKMPTCGKTEKKIEAVH